MARSGDARLSDSRGTSALSLLGGVLLVAVGAVFLSRSLDDLTTATVGLLLVVLGLLSLARSVVRAGSGRGSRAQQGTTPDGTPVTTVRASPFAVLLPLLALAAVALASGVWSWVAWRGANPLLGALLAALALVSLVALALPLARGARPDRVDLSPTGLTTEHFGRRIRVTWDDVHGCVPVDGQPLALVLRDGASATVDSRGWALWRQPTAPDHVLPVVVSDLPVRPDLMARVVALCADDPSLRASLGTDASLDWLTFPPVHDHGGAREA